MRAQTGESNSANAVLDLTTLKWYAKKGIRPGDAAGFDPSESDVKRVQKFPVVLNSIFNAPVGKELRRYTVMTSFVAPPAALKRTAALYFPQIGENWSIHLNGRLLRRDVFPDGKGGIRRYRAVRGLLIPINGANLRAGKNILTIFLTGHGPVAGFIPNTPLGFEVAGGYKLGPIEQLMRERSEKIDIALMGVYFFFGLFYLFFFVRRRDEKYNLTFGVFMILAAFYFFTLSNTIFEIVQDTSINHRLNLALLFPLLPLSLLFMHYYYFASEPTPLFARGALLVGLCSSASTLLVPFPYYRVMILVWVATALPMAFYLLYLNIRAIRENRPDSRTMALAIVFAVACVIWDYIDFAFLKYDLYLSKFGIFAYVMTLVAILANRFLNLNIELQKQKDAFYRFVPTQFLRILGKTSAVDIEPGDSTRRNMTVLFCDIRSFTTISEGMSPDENFEFLNDFLRGMEPAVQKNGGFVDKYMGDAILALFPGEGSAERAVRAAVDMQKELREYNRRMTGRAALGFGIGINTGPLILGTIGSRNRLDTTVIGNTVNVASRLQSLTRVYETELIVSAHTAGGLPGSGLHDIREIDTVLVKGKKEPVTIFEIFDMDQDELRTHKRAGSKKFQEGRNLYARGDFAAARTLFEQAEQQAPGDTIARTYAKRCGKFLREPPAEWSGVFSAGEVS